MSMAPPSDGIRLDFEFRNGKTISSGAPRWIHDVVAAAMTTFAKAPLEDLVQRIAPLLEARNHRDAAAAVVSAVEDGAASGLIDQPLLELLSQIRTDGLPDAEAARLLRARCILATVASDYKRAGRDAQQLLSTSHVDPSERTWLRMTVATAALRCGARVSSFAVFREIAESEECDARSRAWAYRNMSVIVPFKDDRCEEYARKSSDLFLMIGDRVEAAGSLVRAMRSRLTRNPLSAGQVLDEAIGWFQGDGLNDRYVRGGMLQNRARAALMLKQYQRAYDDAIMSIQCLRDLRGCEEELLRSFLLSIESGKQLSISVHNLQTEHDALALSVLGEDYILRYAVFRALESKDPAVVQELKAKEEVRQRPVLRAVLALAEAMQPDARSHVTKLELLESAAKDARDSGEQGIENTVILATAHELLSHGSKTQALEQFQEVLRREPTNLDARQNIGAILQQLNMHDEGVRFLEEQVRIWGELPGLIFTLARFLMGAGEIDRATNLFARVAVNDRIDPRIRKAAADWRDKAIAAGGRIEVPAPALPQIVSRIDFEEALKRFAETIRTTKRMSFWKTASGQHRHRWIERPEAHAKNLLQLFLDGVFGSRVRQFEEIGAGAGRIDLLIELAGGLTVIIELKMLGAPSYSSTYALQGEDQLAHYMDNRQCHLGYLVVFDARTLTWGQLASLSQGVNTIIHVFIDVRPAIPSKTKRTSAGKKKHKK